MSKPSWQEALPPRKAVVVETTADGQTRVVATKEGAEAEELIAKARSAGVEVRKDAQEVDQLLARESGDSNIPPEIYELMSTIITFAQELNDQWGSPAPLPGET